MSKELLDDDGMEEAVLDKKIENVIGAMGCDMSRMNESETLQILNFNPKKWIKNIDLSLNSYSIIYE